jgi:hypothetical protein
MRFFVKILLDYGTTVAIQILPNSSDLLSLNFGLDTDSAVNFTSSKKKEKLREHSSPSCPTKTIKIIVTSLNYIGTAWALHMLLDG